MLTKRIEGRWKRDARKKRSSIQAFPTMFISCRNWYQPFLLQMKRIKLTNLVSRLLARVVVTDDIASLVRVIIDVYNLAGAVRDIVAGTAHRSIFDLVTNLSIITFNQALQIHTQRNERTLYSTI